MPQEGYFSNLREEFIVHFNQIFPSFEFVSEEEILQGITNLLSENELPIISLDRVYFKSQFNLEITRLVDRHKNSKGISNRANSLPIEQQLLDMKKSGFKKVALADDVIFSGNVIKVILPLLSEIGIKVEKIYAGIGISDGIKKISDNGIEICCIRTYEEVMDEICERDFYPGIPFSGRLLEGSNNIGMPYILPFGNPIKWASIPPQYANEISKFCLKQTTCLFTRIEELSGKSVLGKDLDRKVIGIPDSTRFIDELERIAGQL